MKSSKIQAIYSEHNHLEIERKFLVCSPLPTFKNGTFIKQSYIFIDESKEMRVRIENQKFQMTLKFNIEKGVREEFTYTIPNLDGNKLFEVISAHPPIEKNRYLFPYGGNVWEIDIFQGKNAGLILAEIELDTIHQKIDIPSWVGEEVTHIPKYYNANLYMNPYSRW